MNHARFSSGARTVRPRSIEGAARAGNVKPDMFLLGTIATLLVFGLVMLSSASSIESYRQFGGAYFLVERQILRGLLPGLLLFFIFFKIDYRRWQQWSVGLFVASLIVLVLVFIPHIGASYGTAHSWINIAGISFQPAEFVKLMLIMSLAGWFAQRGRTMNEDFWNGLVPFVLVLGSVGLLLMLQPDLGTLIAVSAIAAAMYFVAGAKVRHLTALAAVGLGLVVILIMIAPYRLSRITTFFNPAADTSGTSYQINQALLAIGSGGWFGVGFGQSRQKFVYLPEVIGDSIFAVISEELGFFLSAGVVVLYVVLVWRMLKHASESKDDFARYILVGVSTWFMMQAFFNIGGITALVPLTGIPLPFISYGATALAASLAAAGIVANITSRRA